MLEDADAIVAAAVERLDLSRGPFFDAHDGAGVASARLQHAVIHRRRILLARARLLRRRAHVAPLPLRRRRL